MSLIVFRTRLWQMILIWLFALGTALFGLSAVVQEWLNSEELPLILVILLLISSLFQPTIHPQSSANGTTDQP